MMTQEVNNNFPFAFVSTTPIEDLETDWDNNAKQDTPEDLEDYYDDEDVDYLDEEEYFYFSHKIQVNAGFKRASRDNKKERKRPHKYIKHHEAKKKEEKEAQIQHEIEKRKANPRGTRVFGDPGWSRRAEPKTTLANFQANTQYERDLQKAINMSRTSKHDSGLTFNQLLELSSRELTPEDYELLLLLDSTVEKKKTSKSALNSLKETTINDPTEELCTVCMCGYEVGEKVKHLPCSHFFHSDCIVPWLKNHSQSCPLCNHKIEC
eukprot:TRINITY_DN2565_c0_g1_i1.p1 TRINITY_DN2565_c0_g1~~TRINITY_DN2565_c0_g1_i1.p1  ORF type:complete len:265 (-),score=71.29 TRINITY_DN2565_c0_g1_i1:267-1061(-)